MSRVLPPFDAVGHTIACEHYNQTDKSIVLNSHHDFFCDCHNWIEPYVLAGGTDIAWPVGWTEQQAQEWRAKYNLMPNRQSN